MSKLSLHIQNYSPWMTSAVAALGSGWVKWVNPTPGPDMFPGVTKILRLWTDDWDRACIAKGTVGAGEYMARTRSWREQFKNWGNVYFELPNEPDANSNEGLANLNAFTCRALAIGHNEGVHQVILNIAEGNPHDNGTHDENAVKWKMNQLADALITANAFGDLWGHHVYWCPPVAGPLDIYHSIGKAQALRRYLKEAGIPAPKMVLNEASVDGGIIGDVAKGWKIHGGGTSIYLESVVELNRAAEQDDDILVATLFTAGYNPPWETFNHDENLISELITRLDMALTEEQIGQQLGDKMQDKIIPQNYDTAIARAAEARGLVRMASPETYLTLSDNVTYVAQVWFERETNLQWVAWCVKDDWGRVHFHPRPN